MALQRKVVPCLIHLHVKYLLGGVHKSSYSPLSSGEWSALPLVFHIVLYTHTSTYYCLLLPAQEVNSLSFSQALGILFSH